MIAAIVFILDVIEYLALFWIKTLVVMFFLGYTAMFFNYGKIEPKYDNWRLMEALNTSFNMGVEFARHGSSYYKTFGFGKDT